jgi:hypothetical protein
MGERRHDDVHFPLGGRGKRATPRRSTLGEDKFVTFYGSTFRITGSRGRWAVCCTNKLGAPHPADVPIHSHLGSVRAAREYCTWKARTWRDETLN